jgi:hypothetical protein
MILTGRSLSSSEGEGFFGGERAAAGSGMIVSNTSGFEGFSSSLEDGA